MDIILDDKYHITADDRNYILKRSLKATNEEDDDLSEGFMYIPDEVEEESSNNKKLRGRAVGYYSNLRGAVTRYIEETKPKGNAESLLEYVELIEKNNQETVNKILDILEKNGFKSA